MAIFDSLGNDITGMVERMRADAAKMDEYGTSAYKTTQINVTPGMRYDTTNPYPTIIEAAKHAGKHYMETCIVFAVAGKEKEGVVDPYCVYGFLCNSAEMTYQELHSQIVKNTNAGFQVLDGGAILGLRPLQTG